MASASTDQSGNRTIQFKGICFRADQITNKYDTIPNKAVSVQFTDVNGTYPSHF